MKAVPRLAWLAWGLTMMLSVAGLVLVFLGRQAPMQDDLFAIRGYDALLAITFASVGAPLVVRRPSNPIGGLFLTVAATFGVMAAAEAYAVYALVTREASLPAGEIMAWTHQAAATLVGYLLVAALLFFPDGRLPSRRWRALVGVAVLGWSLDVLSTTFAPGPFPTFRSVDNPFGIGGTAEAWLRAMRDVGELLFVVTMAAAAASLVMRYRRSAAVERQQLKWIASAGTLVALAVVAVVVTVGDDGTGGAARIAQILLVFAVAAFPVSTGLAILRYRLFDIDRIIRRTAAYAAVTALLGGGYVGLVFVFGLLLNPAGGGDLAIAASVLVIALLFRPLHGRVQAGVDRRFDRARYDAAWTIETFSDSLRREIDLETLESQVLAVVETTMRPQHLSLWMRARPPVPVAKGDTDARS
jgi:hypothetical protein